MSNSFNNRVFGCAIIKSINSNYNADFSGQPRKLPNGVVYATDKALKYAIRNFWKKNLGEKVLYFKHLNQEMMPVDLVELYHVAFGTEVKNDDKKTVLKNLLSVIDIKFFGATFAPKGTGISNKNISIHGTCQISHGVNRFNENSIYTEQILAPFTSPGDEAEAAKGNTTIGTQSRLEEGHYVHNFSLNPKNIDALISEDEIVKLKKGLTSGVTFYDSASKIGTENELLLWVQLKAESKAVLPSFVELVSVIANNDKSRTIDLKLVSDLLEKEHIKTEIEKIELYYNKGITKVENVPAGAELKEL
jgi:CRISPR-associated protein Csh2